MSIKKLVSPEESAVTKMLKDSNRVFIPAGNPHIVGGAVDLSSIKSGAKRVVKRVTPYVKRAARMGIHTGIEAGKIGAEVGRVKLEAWKRKKLGEYPYGELEPRPLREAIIYTPKESIIAQELRKARISGETVPIPSDSTVTTLTKVMGCTRCRTIYPIGSNVFTHAGKYYCPQCGGEMR